MLQKKTSRQSGSSQKKANDIHAVDIIDLRAKGRFRLGTTEANKPKEATRFMMMQSQNFAPKQYVDDDDDGIQNAIENPVSEIDFNQLSSSQRQMFMMCATKNNDGSTTTATVAFASNMMATNVAPQFRTKQPRNIVVDTNQPVFGGPQR